MYVNYYKERIQNNRKDHDQVFRLVRLGFTEILAEHFLKNRKCRNIRGKKVEYIGNRKE